MTAMPEVKLAMTGIGMNAVIRPSGSAAQSARHRTSLPSRRSDVLGAYRSRPQARSAAGIRSGFCFFAQREHTEYPRTEKLSEKTFSLSFKQISGRETAIRSRAFTSPEHKKPVTLKIKKMVSYRNKSATNYFQLGVAT